METKIKTPIILIIFNRPEETRKTLEAISFYKPDKLFVICDGPRDEADKIKIDQAKKIIADINWDCQVFKNYSEKNIGCRKALSSGLNWAFGQVDRAMVFESDCVPSQDFFTFCDELLEEYKDDEKIMHISGNFFQHRNKKFRCDNSYYYSILPHIWGWATWSRAWKFYDPDIKVWPEIKNKGELKRLLTNPAVYEYWETVWDGYYNNTVQSWDGQWTFACMLREGLSITPTKNLVTNIGFGPQAMQTKDANSIFANMKLEKVDFPLKHPKDFKVNKNADDFTWRQNFGVNRYLKQRLLGPIRRTFPMFYNPLRNLFNKKS